IPATGPAMICVNSRMRTPRSGPPSCAFESSMADVGMADTGALASREAEAARRDDVALHLGGAAADRRRDHADVGVRVLAGGRPVVTPRRSEAERARGGEGEALVELGRVELGGGRLV